MKTFKQFLTEEDDMSDLFDAMADLYSTNYYKVSDSRECKMVTAIDIASVITDALEEEDDDGGWGGIALLQVTEGDYHKRYDIPHAVADVLFYLKKGYIVILKIYGFRDDHVYCRDKRKLQEFLKSYIRERYDANTTASEQDINSHISNTIKKLDTLP